MAVIMKSQQNLERMYILTSEFTLFVIKICDYIKYGLRLLN